MTHQVDKNRLRRRVHEILEVGDTTDVPSLICDAFIVALILLNVAAFVFGSVETVADRYGTYLGWFEFFSIVIFTVEYVLRIWSAPEYLPLTLHPAWKARLKFALLPYQIIDLVAILPYYLANLVGWDLRILRVLRLFRFFKIVRYSPALQVILRVFYNEGRALLGALMIMVALLLFAATGMTVIEGKVQPETFGDIPRSMWWAIATLTTVGYGDAIPVTTLGKLWAGLFMVFGLGMFALPIGIISTGFAQEIHRREFIINWSTVARVPLFRNLTAKELSEIMRMLHSQRFSPGSVILRAGDRARALYIIVSGSVEMASSEQRVILAPGQFFGELGLISGGEYVMSARANEACHLLRLDDHDFEYLINKNPTINTRIREIAARRMEGQWHLDAD